MKALFVFIPLAAMVLLTLCVSGCSSDQQINSSSTPVPTTIPMYRVGDPASDGNLKVTLISLHYGNRINPNAQELVLTFRIENLKNDETYIIFKDDFTFTSSEFVLTPQNTTNCWSTWDMLEVYPGSYTISWLCYAVPFGAKNLTLAFDFSGPNKYPPYGPVALFEIPSYGHLV
jgi:hypothetical protein